MRELTNVELELVQGGNPLLIAAAVAAGVISLASLALLGYAVSLGCSGSLSITKDGITVEVTCPPPTTAPN